VTSPPAGGLPGAGDRHTRTPEAITHHRTPDHSAAHRQLSHPADQHVPGVVTVPTPERPDGAGDTAEYLAFVRRILAALRRRVVHADIDALAELFALRADLDEQITTAVAAVRHDPETPASWSDIGRAAGIDRSDAYRKFGHVGGARRPGGQPGNLR